MEGNDTRTTTRSSGTDLRAFRKRVDVGGVCNQRVAGREDQYPDTCSDRKATETDKINLAQMDVTMKLSTKISSEHEAPSEALRAFINSLRKGRNDNVKLDRLLWLHIEPEVNYIAFLHDVVFAFEA